MPNVEFHIDGLTQGRVRLDRRTRRLRDYPPAALAVAVIVVAVAATDRSPVAVVNGVDVQGSRVLVLVDTSGSMPGDGIQVRAHLNALTAAGISIDFRSTVDGSALGYGTWGLLRTFESGMATRPDLDTLYVISDYQDSEGNELAAIDGFVATLRAQGMRVYWATVNDDPPPVYYEIAQGSGGGVIPPR